MSLSMQKLGVLADSMSSVVDLLVRASLSAAVAGYPGDDAFMAEVRERFFWDPLALDALERELMGVTEVALQPGDDVGPTFNAQLEGRSCRPHPCGGRFRAPP
ncbi:hypothetical protein APY04_0076 [Hyphomicrobium sulfonivorans]|uniref:Uncharacterized protein n=1 Tax=Hyphomicrobium sulfonivorans TaxID=121290 RepID=A0A109BPD5_HYPSL|nr:hypothetical protein [Hyphomicrobium sulfonivorans]KWT72514.1 hypothetical protein APY04_0076 [Hyphomicrobium sulfonivorans]